MSISQAKSDIDKLIALRNRLASEIDEADKPSDIAVLSRQFLAVLEQIAQIKPPERRKADEIAEKYQLRAVRDSDTPNTNSA